MSARLRTVKVELTVEELADVVVCLRFGLREGIGYGHVTYDEERAAERLREELATRLERQLGRRRR